MYIYIYILYTHCIYYMYYICTIVCEARIFEFSAAKPQYHLTRQYNLHWGLHTRTATAFSDWSWATCDSVNLEDWVSWKLGLLMLLVASSNPKTSKLDEIWIILRLFLVEPVDIEQIWNSNHCDAWTQVPWIFRPTCHGKSPAPQDMPRPSRRSHRHESWWWFFDRPKDPRIGGAVHVDSHKARSTQVTLPRQPHMFGQVFVLPLLFLELRFCLSCGGILRIHPWDVMKFCWARSHVSSGCQTPGWWSLGIIL